MKPTVGQIVHYVSHGTPIRPDGSQAFPSVCRAALVAEVGAWMAAPGDPVLREVEDDGVRTRTVLELWEADACHLDVRNPTGGFFNVCLHDEDTKAGGTWHWPEREEE